MGFPIPTMTFPNNSLTIRASSGLEIRLDTKSMLTYVSKSLPKDIRIPDSANQFWSLKSIALGISNEYDWTYWSEYQGMIDGKPLTWTKCDEIIDYDRLASRSERVHFYESLDFYEDELADNGICICDVRFRVMDFGFFVKLRCYLCVDHVMFQCIETRFYHEFGSERILRETRRYSGHYDSLATRMEGTDRSDIDSIVSHLTETHRYTEQLNGEYH